MPLIIGGSLAVAGIAGNVIGGKMQADAQQEIANAQRASAQADRAAATAAALPTVDELERRQVLYGQQSRAIARQEKLLSAIDPTILEAGKQALQLMRGQDAQTIAPLRAQRATQRSALLANIQRQLGPGGAASSTGLAALNKFDMDTASIVSDAQQKSLQTLLSYTHGQTPNPQDNIRSEQNTLGMLAGDRKDLISAINGTPVTPYAGAPFVGAAYQGAAVSGAGQGLSQLGGSALGYGSLASLMKPGTPAAPGASPGVDPSSGLDLKRGDPSSGAYGPQTLGDFNASNLG